MTEAEFLVARTAALEESVVTAALDCELDPEAIPGLRLALQRSALMTDRFDHSVRMTSGS